MTMHAQGLQIPNHQVYGFASLVVPGLGHFLQRAPFRGALWLPGVWLFRAGHTESKTAQQALRERAVVAYALQHGGRITVAEASVAAQISLHEARNLLERLVLERYAIETEQDGIIYYHLTR